MDTLNLTHIWGGFINYPGNITILMVELAKLKLHWNRIVSCPGIRYVLMDIKEFYLNTFMHRYK